MKKHKWKKIVAIATTIISSIYGINIYTNGNAIHNEIPAASNNHEIILRVNQTYSIEGLSEIVIKTSPIGYWVIITPEGETDDR